MVDDYILENLYQKQFQIYTYIRHSGFVTWRKINNRCNNLIEAGDETERNWYGKYPIYKIFIPLLKNGIVEIANNSNILGYAIAPRVELFYEHEIPNLGQHDIRNHFIIKNKKDTSDFYSYGRVLLKRLPDFKTLIEKWDFYYLSNMSYYIKNDLYKTTSSPENISTECILKKENNPYSPNYFYSTAYHKIYRIPRIPDEDDNLNYVRTYIRLHKQYKKPLDYNSEKKEFTYNFGNELPILVFRALLMHDISKLKLRESFLMEKNQIIFKNIPLSSHKNFLRIFNINSE